MVVLGLVSTSAGIPDCPRQHGVELRLGLLDTRRAGRCLSLVAGGAQHTHDLGLGGRRLAYLVTEVADAGEDHGRAQSVHRLEYFVIAH